MERRKLVLLASALCLLAGCAQPAAYSPPDYSGHTAADEGKYTTQLIDPEQLTAGEPLFAVEERPSTWQPVFRGLTKVETWGYDLRSMDVSSADLSAVEDYNDISFNTGTVWPEELPEGFDPQVLLDHNKDPGLGIRALHEQGITGRGVGVAVIDQALLPDHVEYKDRLRSYERIHCRDVEVQMHGSAVASLAVGQEVGVAPEADLYYIASDFGHSTDSGYQVDASIMADCVLRVLELNDHLPDGEKIRAISISSGCTKRDLGYKDLDAAIRQAEKEGILVMTVDPSVFYPFRLLGMGRDYRADPNDMASYRPANWLEESVYQHPEGYQDFCLVPMGSRTYACWQGPEDYELSCEGGMSWAVPWCAGFYALCCQVEPDLTPERFFQVVQETAVPAYVEHEGTDCCFGKIVDPAAAIAHLQEG